MFFARWLLGYTAWEWWDMPAKERIAYERGLREWLPHILYGSDAIDPKKSRPGSQQNASLDELPGAQIVKAY